MKARIRYDFGYGRVGVGVCSRDEQAVTPFGDRSSDGRDLGRCLALAEDDLGKALSGRAIVIDLREPEVFERRTMDVGGTSFRFGGIETAFTYSFEEPPQRSD